jgi:hypothetical protein
MVAAVIAPEHFYSSRGQKKNSVRYAHKLAEAMLNGHRATSQLLVWDPQRESLYPYT